MKVRLILIALLILAMPKLKAQQGKVGINTEEPTKELDVNGKARIGTIEKQPEGNGVRNLVADYDGTIGEVKFDLETAKMVVADSKVEYITTNETEKSDIDLGLHMDVTIPAHREADIFLFYSVPIAITEGDLRTNRFYGVQLFKSVDGATSEEKKEGAVLFRVTKIITEAGHQKNMNVVSAAKNFVEKINNDTDEDMTISYSLKGFFWQAKVVATTYQFNTFEGTSEEDNDGKSVLTAQIYLNKLDE